MYCKYLNLIDFTYSIFSCVVSYCILKHFVFFFNHEYTMSQYINQEKSNDSNKKIIYRDLSICRTFILLYFTTLWFVRGLFYQNYCDKYRKRR